MPVLALGAPHTTSTTPVPVSTLHTAAVGVGVLLGLEHAGDGEGRELLAGVVDALDLQPHGRELLGQLLDRSVGVEMVLEPGEREFHGDRRMREDRAHPLAQAREGQGRRDPCIRRTMVCADPRLQPG